MSAWDRIVVLRWWRAVVGQWNEIAVIYGVSIIGCLARTGVG